MAKEAIYLSSAGMQLAYGVETVSGQKPTDFTIIPGVTSLAAVNSEKSTIEVTPLSAETYREYVAGLADPGASWEVGTNESVLLHEVWAKVMSDDATAKASGLRTWFNIYIPEHDLGFFLVCTPSELGFGGAEVASALKNTCRLTINQVKGWLEKVVPTPYTGV